MFIVDGVGRRSTNPAVSRRAISAAVDFVGSRASCRHLMGPGPSISWYLPSEQSAKKNGAVLGRVERFFHLPSRRVKARFARFYARLHDNSLGISFVETKRYNRNTSKCWGDTRKRYITWFVFNSAENFTCSVSTQNYPRMEEPHRHFTTPMSTFGIIRPADQKTHFW